MQEYIKKASYQLGIERESLRIQQDGTLSLKSHPKSLGAPLTHKYITTDFAEAQIEIVTPPVSSIEEVLVWLEALTQFVYQEIETEFLWPFSMPFNPPLNPIIAQYGTTQEALQKSLYRKGLLHRYGASKQLISGLHVNWSLDDDFWVFHKEQKKSTLPLQEWKSDQYMHIIRNYIRHAWIVPYLFGTTPCKSIHTKETECFATSLRLGKTGYVNEENSDTLVSYNSLESYLKSMQILLSTEHSDFLKVKEQLNTFLLQKPEEHYFFVRPKSPISSGSTSLQALEQHGVHFLEIRSFDVNPLIALGIGEKELLFTHKLLLHCLSTDSPPITNEERSLCMQNHDLVCSDGRNPDLKLTMYEKTLSVKEHADNLCKILSWQETLPVSVQIQKKLKDTRMSYFDFSMRLAEQHKQEILQKPLRQKCKHFFQNETSLSHAKKQVLEGDETLPIPTMQDMELSTQIFIREAIKKHVSIEILDRQENFVRLQKGAKIEYIKQATKTGKDSYISFLMMENKNVSKVLFQENNICTPKGETYDNEIDAEKAFSLWKGEKIAMKPSTGNFGEGITIFTVTDTSTYKKALKKAFLVSPSIVIEEFVKGEKYRFLIFGEQIVAISKGIAAHVLGDGKNTIENLVSQKNAEKFLAHPIVLTEEDIKSLEAKKLSLQSVLRKGEALYFREISNSPQGGDTIDATDDVDITYHNIAKKSAKVANALICGVDIIIENPEKPATKDNHSVLEINFNPGIALHEVPYSGTPRRVTKALLDFLGF